MINPAAAGFLFVYLGIVLIPNLPIRNKRQIIEFNEAWFSLHCSFGQHLIGFKRNDLK